jgi:hypothetical protein
MSAPPVDSPAGVGIIRKCQRNWTPVQIRAWCAATNRNPALFLEPAPPPNPEPSVVERMALRRAQSPADASVTPNPTDDTNEGAEAPGGRP